ncbi:MAG TPA: redox-regulated ATPase YchF [Candidatus Altiarchaeales archaeon]|nr:redox-regulated ATPase YchF [Candidatus Altiarchaeales archaeon]
MEIGIVGKPNVGKSTFFKALTLADVEIANFPFTTKDANIGIGYVRVECPCREFNIECRPKNSFCVKGNRFVPVRVIDVAGLVPGAHEGKGLGNKFLDDLRRADVLLHVVDISGRTDENGEVTDNYDPEKDIRFLENEIDMWFFNVIKRNWAKISNKVRHQGADIVTELSEQLSGLEINDAQIKESIEMTGLDGKREWDDNDVMKFSSILRKISKPILIVANKIDIDKENFSRLSEKYNMIPTSAESELALKQAERAGFISYIPGDSDFEVLRNMEEKQRKALDFIRKRMFEEFGSTGVQNCLNSAVFDILKMIVVYPVENENRFTDSKGNILPDTYLLPEESTVLDLAYKVHSEIGDKFIGAIDCRTKKRIGKDHLLKNADIIKIITRR